MPWVKSYNETDVLDRATRIFWSKGYAATSISDLVKATGINRGSIYTEFKGKRAFFLRALDYYSLVYCTQFLVDLADAHGPKQAIIEAFDAASTPKTDRPEGCMLINTALELSPHDAEIAEYISGRLRKVEDFFHGWVVTATERGEIQPNDDARDTAQALLGLFIGLRVLICTNPQAPALATIRRQAHSLLG